VTNGGGWHIKVSKKIYFNLKPRLYLKPTQGEFHKLTTLSAKKYFLMSYLTTFFATYTPPVLET